MRYWITLASLAAAGGPALAQVPPAPEQPQPAPPPTDPTAGPEPAPAPTPISAPAPAPPPVVPAPPPAPAPEPPPERRPSALSVAIGFGYQLPTSLQTPNITSLRLRLPSGLAFEPRFVLARSSRTVDTGPSTEQSASEIGIGALARYPLVRRGRMDLELLGGLDVDRVSQVPDSSDEDLTVTTFTAVYGLAVAAWINPHLQVSLSALNPLASSERRDEQMGPGTSTVTTTTTFGAIFDPDVALMIHLYH